MLTWYNPCEHWTSAVLYKKNREAAKPIAEKCLTAAATSNDQNLFYDSIKISMIKFCCIKPGSVIDWLLKKYGRCRAPGSKQKLFLCFSMVPLLLHTTNTVGSRYSGWHNAILLPSCLFTDFSSPTNKHLKIYCLCDLQLHLAYTQSWNQEENCEQ